MKKLLLFIFAVLSSISAFAQEPAKHVTAILGAFGAEVTLIHEKMQDKREITIHGTQFTEGMLNGHHVVLAQTGMGKVNAAITTTLMIDHFSPAEILFTGIAGGVDPQLLPGDLVIGKQIAYHDYGTITPDSMMRRATLNPLSQSLNPILFESTASLVKLAQQVSGTLALNKVANRTPKIVTGIIVTGDVFVSSAAATQQLWLKMHAEATEMEGAAVAQTCWQQKVPFLVIRSLSDNAGNKAHDDVAAFYQTAAHNSATLVMAIVAEIK